MGVEIERKFLVVGDQWRAIATGQIYRQGYIPTQGFTTVRVRVVGDRGYLTIKGAMVGLARAEYEYPIPLADAEEMLETLCDRPLIEKMRYVLEQDGLRWEIDEFKGANQGLILAEVELSSPDQPIPLPDWVGRDVSHDSRYFNANLARVPFTQWPENRI